MKKIISIIMAMCLAILCIAPVNFAKGNVEKKVSDGEELTYIIKCDNKEQYQKIRKELNEKKKIVINHCVSDENLFEESKAMVVSLCEKDLMEYKQDYDIIVEKDRILSACSNNDELIPIKITETYSDKLGEYSDNPKEFVPCQPVKNSKYAKEIIPWNISCISEKPYDNKYKGKSIKVAVIDSGIDVHDELNTKEWIDLSDKVNGYKPIDSSGHATSVSGIIGARKNGIGIMGIANEAEMYSIKVLNEDNTTNISNVVKALEWCIDNDIDIVNMSFGMDNYSKILQESIDRAYEKGIILISSSGNNTNAIQYPAAYTNVISVGSINKDLRASDFSKNNHLTDLVAPGEDVYTLDYCGGYCTCSGTSVAAAHVTGVAAAILSSKKIKSGEMLKNVLLESSVELSDGSRLVNYDNAMKYIKKSRISNDISNIIRANINLAIDESEDDILKASWATRSWGDNNSYDEGTGHKSMINKMPLKYFGNSTESTTNKKHNRDIVADAACRADDLEWLDAGKVYGNAGRDEFGNIDLSKPPCISPYHAKSEYSFYDVNSHATFLYELARRRLILNLGLNFEPRNFEGDSWCGVNIPQLMQRRIIVDLGAVYEQQCIVFGGTNYCKNVRRHKGSMIPGIFLHLIQDIQAHRAKFTPNMIFANNEGTSYYIGDTFTNSSSNSTINGQNIKGVLEGDYSTYWSLYNAINQHGGSIPMIRLKDFLRDKCSINCGGVTSCKPSAAYEDNPFFYRDRYNAAYNLSLAYIDRMKGDTDNSSKELGTYLYYPNVPLFTDSY